MTRAPLEDPPRAGLTRRALLAGVGAGAALASLAACTATGSAPRPTAAADRSARDATLRWTNWPAALDEGADGGHPTLEAFEEATGIDVRYRASLTSNRAFWREHRKALAAGDDIGTDLVCLTDWMAARLVAAGEVQRLGTVPNAARLLPRLAHPDFDPARARSVPFRSCLVGLCWDPDEVPGGLTRVSDLWDPSLAGRVGVLGEMRHTMGLLLADAGIDVSRPFSDDDFMAAVEVLRTHLDSGQIHRNTTSSYLDDLRDGTTVASMCWSDDIVALRASTGREWGFAVPGPGGLIFSNDFVVPMGSPHLDNAVRLIDHYCDPAVAAEVTAWTGAVCPVSGARAALAKVDPAAAKDPLLFPSEETLARTRPFRTLSTAQEENYRAVFRDALLAGTV